MDDKKIIENKSPRRQTAAEAAIEVHLQQKRNHGESAETEILEFLKQKSNPDPDLLYGKSLIDKT